MIGDLVISRDMTYMIELNRIGDMEVLLQTKIFNLHKD